MNLARWSLAVSERRKRMAPWQKATAAMLKGMELAVGSLWGGQKRGGGRGRLVGLLGPWGINRHG